MGGNPPKPEEFKKIVDAKLEEIIEAEYAGKVRVWVDDAGIVAKDKEEEDGSERSMDRTG